MPELDWLVAVFPNFVRYVVVGFALAALFLWIYVLITPWREFTLIRAGNSAAATALVGALLGFEAPSHLVGFLAVGTPKVMPRVERPSRAAHTTAWSG